jgi:hypothetical protein
MRQKTINLRNKGYLIKNSIFFPDPKLHTQVGSLSAKNGNSHTWAPLNRQQELKQATAENEKGMTEKSRWDQPNRQQKPGLVGRNRKKISQIIKDYFYLPFFLLIILWPKMSIMQQIVFK